MALSPHEGAQPEDLEIAKLQEAARTAEDPGRSLESLGWRFVAKARMSYDPGYYTLAEQTALCVEGRQPDHPGALLLRGHALHQLHRFREMEELARRLVADRGSAFDHGLLGDALMEQGRLSDALPAYQQMIDLQPNLQSYSRVAHVRWLRGDLDGAREVMRLAIHAGSPRDGEALAWAFSRMAVYELQAGRRDAATQSVTAALQLVPDYAPALLVRGQILLHENSPEPAIAPLRRAAEQNPLPEFRWALADALRAAGRESDAREVEVQLESSGAREDPRTFALYLATRGREPQTALRLAQEEIQRRQDVLTYDALAWSQAAAGRIAESRVSIERALAEGTQDARLFYHAGVIAGLAGRPQEARRWLERAAALQQMLLPSERDRLAEHHADLASAPARGGA